MSQTINVRPGINAQPDDNVPLDKEAPNQAADYFIEEPSVPEVGYGLTYDQIRAVSICYQCADDIRKCAELLEQMHKKNKNTSDIFRNIKLWK